MRQLVPVSRCKFPRCAAATRIRILVVLAICITLAASCFFVSDRQSVHNNNKHLVDVGPDTSRVDFDDYFAVDQPSETGGFGTSGPAANSDPFNSHLRNRQLTRERFNAALAAGLIDPSGIGFADPIFPGPSTMAKRWISLSGPGVSIQNPARGMESGAQLVTVSIPTAIASAAANPTKPIDAVSSLARAMSKIVSTPPARSAEAEQDVMIPVSSHGENHRNLLISRNKPLSVRFMAGAGIGSPSGSSMRERGRLHNSSSNGAKAESSADQRTDDHELKSRDLSENFQRFASDFVRANQTENVAEQHRFFAESVHFYREGDLSLAGVVSATRRHHRDQQITRSEVAGPAVATGPVNGGFFVIEQPVRWTRSEGSKLTQGLSVLQLRVVPVSDGSWKITSIDEVKR